MVPAKTSYGEEKIEQEVNRKGPIKTGLLLGSTRFLAQEQNVGLAGRDVSEANCKRILRDRMFHVTRYE